MVGWIETVADLESVIGRTPPAIALKVIDHLDRTALHWIAHSPLMFAALGGGGATAVTLGGGERGFAAGDQGTLKLPLDALDDAGLLAPGRGFGSLFLIPGIGETLRVNGTVAGVGDGIATVAVQECYVHCAKALIRSDFWRTAPAEDMPADPAGFVAACRFMALATCDPAGNADLSPKGDPAGCMVRLEGDALSFADRPGNRRLDSFRNLLARPVVAAALLVPGSCKIAIVRGNARLTTDAALREQFRVMEKMPLLTAVVEGAEVTLHDSKALERAGLWPVGAVPDIDRAGMFAAHLKLNRDKGLAAKIASAMVSVPGLMSKGLERDYKKNLY